MKQLLRDQLENHKAKIEASAILHIAMNATASSVSHLNNVSIKLCAMESPQKNTWIQ